MFPRRRVAEKDGWDGMGWAKHGGEEKVPASKSLPQTVVANGGDLAWDMEAP